MSEKKKIIKKEFEKYNIYKEINKFSYKIQNKICSIPKLILSFLSIFQA